MTINRIFNPLGATSDKSLKKGYNINPKIIAIIPKIPIIYLDIVSGMKNDIEY